MMNKKEKQLGINPGTAAYRLRRMIMFDLAQRLGETECYRCGLPINSWKDFSIDHKKNWLDSDTALFWDLDNIAFSHKSCNYAHHRSVERVKKPRVAVWKEGGQRKKRWTGYAKLPYGRKYRTHYHYTREEAQAAVQKILEGLMDSSLPRKESNLPSAPARAATVKP